jgi:hypothetical protein
LNDVKDFTIDQIELEHPREVTGEIGFRLQAVDRRQLAVERPQPDFFRARLVHEARVEVADFLRLGARRAARGLRGIFDDRAEIRLRFVDEHVERTVRRFVGRDCGPGEPDAVGVIENVVLRPDVLVEGGDLDPGRFGRISRRRAFRATGAPQ